MRSLFLIVAALGIALTGFSVYEIRVVDHYRARVRYVQSALVALGEKQVADAHREGAVFTGQTLGDALRPELDGVDSLERGWFAAASAGIIICVAGVAGAIGRRTLPSNKSLQATASGPAS